tara:strand:+ start:10088 stop:10390 length:303 start_codon:yes stop_codon:yes gene_type:complete
MKRELPYTTAWQVLIFDMQDHCESIFFKDWEHAQAYAKAKNHLFLTTTGCLKYAETKLIPIWKQPLTHNKDINRIEEEINHLLFNAEKREKKEAIKEKEN